MRLITAVVGYVVTMDTVDHSAPFRLSIAEDGTVVAGGEVDMAVGPELEALVMPLVRQRSVVIDLSAVSFLDSSGLRSLLRIAQIADEHGTDLVVRSPSPEVGRLFELTGTRDRFTIEV
ncbi:MAG: hypothetical protein RI958_3115 [Actinomycetota bacterium]